MRKIQTQNSVNLQNSKQTNKQTEVKGTKRNVEPEW